MSRWWVLPRVRLAGDSVGPWLRGFSIWQGHGWFPRPHAPEYGPALYWFNLPLVAGADSLRAVARRRALVSACAGPLLAWSLARREAGGWRGGLFAGALLSGSLGLLRTLESGYQTFMAPELAALMAALWLSARAAAPGRQAALLPVVLVLAGMVHPFALCLAPALLALGPLWGRRGQRPAVATGLALALFLAAPHLLALLGPVWSERSTDSLTRVALMHGQPASRVGLLWESLRGAFFSGDAAGPILLAAPLLLGWQGVRGAGSEGSERARLARAAAVTTLAASLVLLGLGAAIGYLRPYHWRILEPWQALCAGLWWAGLLESARRSPRRLWRWGSFALGLAPLLLLLQGELWQRPAQRGDVAHHRALARAIEQDAGARRRWMEMVALGTHPWGSPPALYLEQRLGGASDDLFTRPEWLYLTVYAPRVLDPDLEALSVGRGWRRVEPTCRPAEVGGPSCIWLFRVEDAAAGRALGDALCSLPGVEAPRREGGAGDVLNLTWPDRSPEWAERWFSSACRAG